MPTLRYTAMDADGRRSSGTLTAQNPLDLEQRLERMGLLLITCREARQRTGLFGGGRISRRDLINFCFHLEQLTRAGVPLLEGLNDLRDTTTNPRFREVVSSIVEDLEGGKLFSEALAAYPRIFDRVFVSLIRAGEETGGLPDILLNLTESLKWQDELIAKTKQLLTYPAIVSVVVTAVIFFLMIYLVPQLVGFIENMGQTIPLQTRLLIGLSNLFVAYWYAILFAPVAAYLLLRWIVARNPNARYAYDRFKLRVWVVGPILQKLILARMTDIFALMYSSGIPLLRAIEINREVVANQVIQRGLEEASEAISRGETISAAFNATGLFPALVVRMLRVGESTGALDTSLRNVSYFYNREVNDDIGRLQAMIEPALTIFLGAILGWVMLSVLGPIYDIMTKIKF